MMHNTPTIEEAKSLAFQDLARIIRTHLQIRRSSFGCEVSENRVRAWIDILESKIPRPPPYRLPIKQPEGPTIPAEPIIQEPPHAPSVRYEALKRHYAELIGG